MIECTICEHAKMGAIDVALANGRSLGLVAHQFRVKKMDVLQHLKHSPAQALHGIRDDEPMVTENPFSQFKQAWRLAKDDPTLQEMMVRWLNDQLASDNMGL